MVYKLLINFFIFKMKLLISFLKRGIKILRTVALANFNMFRHKFIIIFKFVKNFVIYLRLRLVTILFGEPLGTFWESDPRILAYPIIILNNKLLLELDRDNDRHWYGFFDYIFSQIGSEIWDTNKEKEYCKKLNELLKGKHFPLESPFVSQKEGVKPLYFNYPFDIPMENWYRHTNLDNDFTLR